MVTGYEAIEAVSISIWKALECDVDLLSKGISLSELIEHRLWQDNEKSIWRQKRRSLVDGLLSREEDWFHWLDWIDDRFDGRPSDEEKDIARLTLPDEKWDEGTRTIDGVKAVNAEIARRLAEIDERRALAAAVAELGESAMASLSPRAPDQEDGVRFRFGENGLQFDRSLEVVGADPDTQSKLHTRLRTHVAQLLEQSERASNHHPGIATLVREYASLIDVPFREVDPIDLWAVGTGLQGFVLAYEPGAAAQTMTGPLEPEHFAKLVQVARIHAGFVLGFDEVEKTVERGVRFARENSEIVAEIAEPQGRLLHELVGQSKWIDEAARELISAIDGAYMQFGWKVAEAGYAAFGTLKNALLAVSKSLVVIDDLFIGLLGKTLRKGMDAEKILAFAAACFLRDHAADILAFARPLPDLRDWFLYVIDHINARSRCADSEA